MKNKIIAILFISLLITGTALAQQVLFIKQDTSLKLKPNGETITTLPTGTKIEAVKSDGSWRKVKITGWIKKSDTVKSKSAIPTDKVIKSFSGNGMKSTRPFKVDGSWEVQWNASGQVFQIYLYTKSGQMVGVIANQQGAGAGSAYQSKEGEYYMKINAMGSWDVKVVDVQ